MLDLKGYLRGIGAMLAYGRRADRLKNSERRNREPSLRKGASHGGGAVDRTLGKYLVAHGPRL